MDAHQEVRQWEEKALALGEHIETQQNLIQDLETENDQLHDQCEALKAELASGPGILVTPDITPTHASASMQREKTGFMVAKNKIFIFVSN